jgi:hypothetical protein
MSDELKTVEANEWLDVVVKGRVKAVANGVAHIQIEQQTLNIKVANPAAKEKVVAE